MPVTDRLFCEDINEALREVVGALGGAKKVGALMWPEKTVEQAQALLLACLNTERKEHLTPEQTMFLLRRAREANCHVAMRFLCAQAGYADPVPVEPEDERAKLQREFIAATQVIRHLGEKLGIDDKLPSHLRVAR